MSTFKYFTKIDIACSMHVKASGGLLSECSIVGNPERKMTDSEVEACRQLMYVFFCVCVCVCVCVNRPFHLRTMTGKLHYRLLMDGIHDG